MPSHNPSQSFDTYSPVETHDDVEIDLLQKELELLWEFVAFSGEDTIECKSLSARTRLLSSNESIHQEHCLFFFDGMDKLIPPHAVTAQSHCQEDYYELEFPADDDSIEVTKRRWLQRGDTNRKEEEEEEEEKNDQRCQQKQSRKKRSRRMRRLSQEKQRRKIYAAE
eukprot:CAMPEP_0202473398 /NCGR_PEP_ID=MMETSP1360-20130828/90870_1 /ASSEMBLY_ACC=CAM_ASM_000848 /TAXON_ID=515479 /ORGANISM="Licmophora paradoxa, Strain CCMP2313" /LENGTH=166 /DNA_ID=CAMNT_0049100293 /DNA_START=90 /DNA_END=590 /DNA_ORIENTATION=-